MVELRYIGTHQPKGMIIDVEELEIKKFLNSGEYETIVKKSETIIIKEDINGNSNRIKK